MTSENTGVYRAPPVSAIIPVYNGESFIRRAIDSVLAQTVPVREIVVVNDGSTDSTPEILRTEYEGRIKVVTQANGGLANARNRGIEAASGMYVAFLDADDFWAPEKVALHLAAQEAKPEASGSYSGLMVFSDDRGEGVPSSAEPLDGLAQRLRFRNSMLPPSAVMMRRDVLMQLGMFRAGLRACEDWDLWFRFLREHQFAVVDAPVTWYRESNTGLSSDAQFMFDSFVAILDEPLLAGMTGWKRALWRQRLLSYQAYKAVLTARGRGDDRLERRFMWRSLRAWPSPFWAPERFKAFAVTLLRPDVRK